MKEKQQRGQVSATTVLLIALAACVIYAVSGGIRSNYGMLRSAITAGTNIREADISFVLAVAQLSFGVMQPVFGMVALRRSNGFVLCCGAVMVITALLVIPYCTGTLGLLLFFGLLLAGGMGGFSFGIIMGAITPALGSKRAATVSGFVSASPGLGSMILSPLLQGLLSAHGLRSALLTLCVPVALLIPVALWLNRFRVPEAPRREEQKESLISLFREAARDRSYRCLLGAFTTCGFFMAIIETHLYQHITSLGFSAETAAFAFSVYGVTTILGSVFSGSVMTRTGMKWMLGGLFAARPIAIAAFLLLPKSAVTVYCFAGLLGFTGSSTVPPTSGLVERLFGARKLAALFGVAFFFHQIGAFASAWLGGVLLEATGGYTVIWVTAGVLAAVAALLSFSVKEPAA